MTREELISECKRQFEGGADVETAIGFLRVSGCSKIDSIVVIMGAFDVGLAKAKEIVHFSPTWSDARISDERFHEALVDAITNETKSR